MTRQPSGVPFMVENRVELIMDYLSKQQNRLVSIMVTGFVIGFVVGVVSAWFFMVMGR